MGRDGEYAVVYVNGKKNYLGKFGSEEAQKNYRRFLTEWAAVGGFAALNAGKVCLLDELALEFLTWAKENCGRSDYGNYRTAIETALEIYSGVPVTEFGPKSLRVVRDQFVLRGYTRGHCNKLTGLIKTIFHWGVSEELVLAYVHDNLKKLIVLRKGRTTAPESIPRQDVPDEIVERTLPYLYPTIAEMVQVQRLAAMRPSEVCRMCVGDIDRYLSLSGRQIFTCRLLYFRC